MSSSSSSSPVARIAARARARLSSPDAAALLLLATAALIIGFGASVRHVAVGGGGAGGDGGTSLAALADAAAAAKAARPPPTPTPETAAGGGHGRHGHAGPAEACGDALAIPKVALMFLTRAGLYHEVRGEGERFFLSFFPSRRAPSLSPNLLSPLSQNTPSTPSTPIQNTNKKLTQSAWAAWFRTAEGVIPHPALWATNDSATTIEETGGAASPDTACAPSSVARLDRACGPAAAAASRSGPGGILSAQSLFSVYVHAAPDYAGFAPDSIFSGTLIETRIAASWGGHDLVDVTRALLKAALTDPRNTRFALLSESGVPIYPAPVVWAALTHNPVSRINACVNPWNDEQRWHPDFGVGGPGVKADGTGAAPLGPPVPKSAWRKSSQWSVLTRSHAELVVADTAVDALFRAICRSRDWDEALQRRYDCYSDEHYIPTLLAVKGLDNQTDCLGFYINVDWSAGGAHPRTYGVRDVRPSLFSTLREAWGDCDPNAAMALGRALFGPPATLLGRGGDGRAGVVVDDSCGGAPAAWSGRLLPKACPLFARKFPVETAGAVAAALTDCGSGVVPGGNGGCVVGGWEAWEARERGKKAKKKAEDGGGGGDGGR
jgi:hypothetical protein